MKQLLVGLTIFTLVCVWVGSLSASEKEDGWIQLFNGKDKAGWALRNPKGIDSWSVKDGILTNTKPASGRGTDLVTEAKFMDCEFYTEFKVEKNGNSGFYLQGRYEIQICDSFGAKKLDNGMCGAVYGKVVPTKNAAKKPGEWQVLKGTFHSAQLGADGKKVKNARVTVFLNGEKIIDNQEIDGLTGGSLDDKEGTPGPVFLQGDHESVWYKVVKIKPIK